MRLQRPSSDEVAKYGVPTIKHAYGYPQLSRLLRAIPRFEVGGAGVHVGVKDKEARSAARA